MMLRIDDPALLSALVDDLRLRANAWFARSGTMRTEADAQACRARAGVLKQSADDLIAVAAIVEAADVGEWQPLKTPLNTGT